MGNRRSFTGTERKGNADWRRVGAGAGRRSLWAEIGPFCALSFAGLGLSTATVSLVTAWAGHAGFGALGRTLAAEGANCAAFGSLWIAQYLILDKVLFRTPTGGTGGVPPTWAA